MLARMDAYYSNERNDERNERRIQRGHERQQKADRDLEKMMEEMINANQAKTNANLKEMRDQIWTSGNKMHS
jgi:hypothetical protein